MSSANIAVTSRSFSKHPILRKELCQRYSQVRFNEEGKTLQGTALIDFLQDQHMAIVGLERMSQDVLEQLPQLKVISRFGVGLDTVDLTAVAQLGIRLSVTAGANKRAVAELVIGLAINVLRHLPNAHQALRAGIWQQQKGKELSHSCVGIVGFGAVGKEVALLLQTWGCRIMVYDALDHQEYCAHHHLQQVDLPTLLQVADIVTLHLPLTAQTRLLLNEDHLLLMKSDAILINTARGELVDEAILKKMLKNNLLAGAACDVFSTEPPTDQELLSLPNFFATPHVGGSTEQAILAMGRAAIEGLEFATVLEK